MITEVSMANPIMAGFPIHSISKFTQILLINEEVCLFILSFPVNEPVKNIRITPVLNGKSCTKLGPELSYHQTN